MGMVQGSVWECWLWRRICEPPWSPVIPWDMGYGGTWLWSNVGWWSFKGYYCQETSKAIYVNKWESRTYKSSRLSQPKERYLYHDNEETILEIFINCFFYFFTHYLRPYLYKSVELNIHTCIDIHTYRHYWLSSFPFFFYHAISLSS